MRRKPGEGRRNWGMGMYKSSISIQMDERECQEIVLTPKRCRPSKQVALSDRPKRRVAKLQDEVRTLTHFLSKIKQDFGGVCQSDMLRILQYFENLSYYLQRLNQGLELEKNLKNDFLLVNLLNEIAFKQIGLLEEINTVSLFLKDNEVFEYPAYKLMKAAQAAPIKPKLKRRKKNG
jgi:hypothetical protein